MEKFSYVIKDPEGIHARPAGRLVSEAKKYMSDFTITKEGKTVDGKKLMAVMALGVKCGQTIEVAINGEDEEKACREIQQFFEENL